MRLNASVSLEYDLQPVQTVRGEIDVPNARLGARRAAELAFRTYPGARWRSMVIVLEKPEHETRDETQVVESMETARVPHAAGAYAATEEVESSSGRSYATGGRP